METAENIIYGPEFPFPVPECSLGEYLINQMKTLPKDDIIQVDSETGESQTVGEVLKIGLGVAQGLINLGLQENDIVAFVCRDRREIDGATLGVTTAGGVVAYVGPLTEFEIKNMFELIRPKYIFTETEFLENVEKALNFLEIEARIILFDFKEEQKLSHGKFEELITKVDVETYKPRPIKSASTQLAFIMPSSGSTGIPKAVGLTHRNLLFRLVLWKFYGELLHQMKCLQYPRFYGVVGALTLLLSLATGTQRIWIKNPTDENVLKAIHKFKPTLCSIFPSVIAKLMNHPDFKKYDVSSIKIISIGGSVASEHLINRVKKEWNEHTVVQNVYGMTELGGSATQSDTQNNMLSVGKLGHGMQMKIMDQETNKPLGANKKGEVCIKSNMMMKGYVGNPKATKEVIDGDGWYHTGDLGYYDDDHNLYIVDRIKEIMKFNAIQVSPAELENLIEKLPGVLEAAVVGIPQENDSQHPMALVVKQKGSNVSEEDVIRFVKENLSDHKHLRGGVKFVDCIPRTPTGKIKRSLMKELALTLYHQK